jgi:hypothetical protein
MVKCFLPFEEHPARGYLTGGLSQIAHEAMSHQLAHFPSLRISVAWRRGMTHVFLGT